MKTGLTCTHDTAPSMRGDMDGTATAYCVTRVAMGLVIVGAFSPTTVSPVQLPCGAAVLASDSLSALTPLDVAAIRTHRALSVRCPVNYNVECTVWFVLITMAEDVAICRFDLSDLSDVVPCVWALRTRHCDLLEARVFRGLYCDGLVSNHHSSPSGTGYAASHAAFRYSRADIGPCAIMV